MKEKGPCKSLSLSHSLGLSLSLSVNPSRWEEDEVGEV